MTLNDEVETITHCEALNIKNMSPFIDVASSSIADEKMKIDRKKLEQMIQANVPNDETAEKFFDRIMRETNTQITWPSKLKIGAKSKKDPHIKICGEPCDILNAKTKIMEVLDIKRNRVTLKMDVAYTDHSHIIGKGGRSIQQVMRNTGCHIHFPDSNRNSASSKSNQVSIAGEPCGVEKARIQIRNLQPIVVTFEMPITGCFQPLPDSSSPFLIHLQRQYLINVSYHSRHRNSTTTVIVRGSNNQYICFREGLYELIDFLTSKSNIMVPVTMSLEVASQNHAYVVGPSFCNIHKIMNKTRTNITVPEVVPSPEIGMLKQERKTAFVITGKFEDVYVAWKELTQCLPLTLMFDIIDETSTDILTTFQKNWNITVSTRQRPKQNSKNVMIKGAERDTELLFVARKALIAAQKTNNHGCCSSIHDDSLLNFTFPLKGSWNDPSLDKLGVLSESAVTANTFLTVMNGFRNFSFSPFTTNGYMMQPRPDFPYQDSSTSEKSSTGTSSLSSPSLSPRNSPVNLHPIYPAYPTMPTMMPSRKNQQASEQNLSGLWNDAVLFPKEYQRQNEAGTFMLNREQNISQSAAASRPVSRQSSDHDKNAHLSSLLISKPEITIGGIDCSKNVDLGDYKHKKLLATKAMKTPVSSERRKPTNIWSGCGFSKSMNNRLLTSSDSLFSAFQVTSPNNIWKDPGNCNYVSPCDHCSRGDGFLSASNCFESISQKPTTVPYQDVKDLTQLLMSLNMESCIETFQRNEVDLTSFWDLKDSDLQEMRISKPMRDKLLYTISNFNAQRIQQGSRHCFQAAPGAERSFLMRAVTQTHHN